MIADIYSHMLYQLSYAEALFATEKQNVDTEGFEPSTSRMRNGRSSTELSAPLRQSMVIGAATGCFCVAAPVA